MIDTESSFDMVFIVVGLKFFYKMALLFYKIIIPVTKADIITLNG